VIIGNRRGNVLSAVLTCIAQVYMARARWGGKANMANQNLKAGKVLGPHVQDAIDRRGQLRALSLKHGIRESKKKACFINLQGTGLVFDLIRIQGDK
jgi:hypothetical protein